MKLTSLALLATLAGSLGSTSAGAAAPTMTIDGQSAGPTPFISELHGTIGDPETLKSIQFTVVPKWSSFTKPVKALYSSEYLVRSGYLDLQSGQVTLPVFGLYADYDNTVELKASFRRGVANAEVTVTTVTWDDPTGRYTNPSVVQPRLPLRNLGYDYIMLKGYVGDISPVIIDTDGEVRWVGTAGVSSRPAFFQGNGIYIGNGSRLTRMELNGAFADVADYASLGVTGFHHTFDQGRDGILLQADTTTAIETTFMEVDATGQVLKTWSLANIIGAAMVADGDDPSSFVRAGDDWFHSNATTYRKADDTLIISSRENFVIALDYDTGAIRWIFGDPTKAWYQFPSLRKYSLTPLSTSRTTTHPPIGQHAVSIARGNKLMLFDNGAGSQNQSPAGETRDYSAARSYRTNTRFMTAKETWTYIHEPSIYSPFCGSVYEDRGRRYVLDYALAGPFVSTDIVGVAGRSEVFHYSYPLLDSCGVAISATPIHLEKLTFP